MVVNGSGPVARLTTARAALWRVGAHPLRAKSGFGVGRRAVAAAGRKSDRHAHGVLHTWLPAQGGPRPTPALCERGLRAMHGRHPYGRRDRRQDFASTVPSDRTAAKQCTVRSRLSAWPRSGRDAGAAQWQSAKWSEGTIGPASTCRPAPQPRWIAAFGWVALIGATCRRSGVNRIRIDRCTAHGSATCWLRAECPGDKRRHDEGLRLVLDAPGCQLARLDARQGCDRHHGNASANFADTAPIPGIAPERPGLTRVKPTSPSDTLAVQLFQADPAGPST